MQTHISDILCQGSWAVESLGTLPSISGEQLTGVATFVSGGICHILRSEGLRNHDVFHCKFCDMAAGQLVVIFSH